VKNTIYQTIGLQHTTYSALNLTRSAAHIEQYAPGFKMCLLFIT